MIQLTSLSYAHLRNILCVFSIVVLVGLLSSSTVALAQPINPIPAFPGAEGHGALALNTCDRNDVKVIQVTNLNSSGPGTLRDAIENQLRKGKLDIIIFRTGGTIHSTGEIRISNNCVYIAGQTAPGDGIQIRGKRSDLTFDYRFGRANNIVVRYLRLRAEKEGEVGRNDVVTIFGSNDIILDHVSMQWGNDAIMDIYGRLNEWNASDIYNVTIQRSIMAEGVKPHSTGMLLGDYSAGGHYPTYDVSLHHNVFAHNSHRNPRGGSTRTQIANNIVYNWKHRAGSTLGDAEWDYVNNTYIKGPWTRTNSPDYRWLRHEPCFPGKPPYPETPSIYIDGNIFGSGATSDADQWTRIRQSFTCTTNYSEQEELPIAWRRTTPLDDAPVPVTVQSAADARDSVLADVGANQRLDCDGSWVWVQDRVDIDIIQDIQQGTGPATDEENDNPSDYGGFPILDQGTPCADSDSDGMPDEWEQRYFASMTAAAVNADTDSDGYTNIEEYLNGTNPVGPIPGAGPTFLPGMGSPVQDLDGDGKAEDLNGNGRFDFADVVAFFQYLDSQVVQANSNDFDFTGDGLVDMADVRELFFVALY